MLAVVLTVQSLPAAPMLTMMNLRIARPAFSDMSDAVGRVTVMAEPDVSQKMTVELVDVRVSAAVTVETLCIALERRRRSGDRAAAGSRSARCVVAPTVNWWSRPLCVAAL